MQGGSFLSAGGQDGCSTLMCSHPAFAGEVLGCTAPVVAKGTDAIVFVADGRFHLEAIMIANPSIPAYR